MVVLALIGILMLLNQSKPSLSSSLTSCKYKYFDGFIFFCWCKKLKKKLFYSKKACPLESTNATRTYLPPGGGQSSTPFSFTLDYIRCNIVKTIFYWLPYATSVDVQRNSPFEGILIIPGSAAHFKKLPGQNGKVHVEPKVLKSFSENSSSLKI